MRQLIMALGALALAVTLTISSQGAFALAFKAANPPHPTHVESGDPPTVVNGDSSEWDLTDDFFANMYRAAKNDPNHPVESKLYLRYDCSARTLYALVLGVEDVPVLVLGDDAFIKIPEIGLPGDKLVDGAGGGLSSATFAWISERASTIEDFEGTIADGWEASAPLDQGSYELNVHTQVWDDGESQTSAVLDRGIPLIIDCDPTAITLPSSSITVEASSGRVTLSWETATEFDNAGFNLYRATGEAGPWVQVNDVLIAAQGDPVSGAIYSFMDRPGYGAFYYQLEDMNYAGVGTLHEPLLVELGSPFRVPRFRPLLPEF